MTKKAIFLLLLLASSYVIVAQSGYAVADEGNGSSKLVFGTKFPTNSTAGILFAGNAQFLCTIENMGNNVTCTLTQTCMQSYGCQYGVDYSPRLVASSPSLACIEIDGSLIDPINFYKLISVNVSLVRQNYAIPNQIQLLFDYEFYNGTGDETFSQDSFNVVIDQWTLGGDFINYIGPTTSTGNYSYQIYYLNQALASISNGAVIVYNANVPALYLPEYDIGESNGFRFFVNSSISLKVVEYGYDYSPQYSSLYQRQMLIGNPHASLNSYFNATPYCSIDTSTILTDGNATWFCQLPPFSLPTGLLKLVVYIPQSNVSIIAPSIRGISFTPQFQFPQLVFYNGTTQERYQQITIQPRINVGSGYWSSIQEVVVFDANSTTEYPCAWVIISQPNLVQMQQDVGGTPNYLNCFLSLNSTYISQQSDTNINLEVIPNTQGRLKMIIELDEVGDSSLDIADAELLAKQYDFAFGPDLFSFVPVFAGGLDSLTEISFPEADVGNCIFSDIRNPIICRMDPHDIENEPLTLKYGPDIQFTDPSTLITAYSQQPAPIITSRNAYYYPEVSPDFFMVNITGSDLILVQGFSVSCANPNIASYTVNYMSVKSDTQILLVIGGVVDSDTGDYIDVSTLGTCEISAYNYNAAQTIPSITIITPVYLIPASTNCTSSCNGFTTTLLTHLSPNYGVSSAYLITAGAVQVISFQAYPHGSSLNSSSVLATTGFALEVDSIFSPTWYYCSPLDPGTNYTITCAFLIENSMNFDGHILFTFESGYSAQLNLQLFSAYTLPVISTVSHYNPWRSDWGGVGFVLGQVSSGVTGYILNSTLCMLGNVAKTPGNSYVECITQKYNNALWITTQYGLDPAILYQYTNYYTQILPAKLVVGGGPFTPSFTFDDTYLSYNESAPVETQLSTVIQNSPRVLQAGIQLDSLFTIGAITYLTETIPESPPSRRKRDQELDALPVVTCQSPSLSLSNAYCFCTANCYNSGSDTLTVSVPFTLTYNPSSNISSVIGNITLPPAVPFVLEFSPQNTTQNNTVLILLQGGNLDVLSGVVADVLIGTTVCYISIGSTIPPTYQDYYTDFTGIVCTLNTQGMAIGSYDVTIVFNNGTEVISDPPFVILGGQTPTTAPTNPPPIPHENSSLTWTIVPVFITFLVIIVISVLLLMYNTSMKMNSSNNNAYVAARTHNH